MSVWQPVDHSNIGEIVNSENTYEVFRPINSNTYWYRKRSPQERAEMMILQSDLNPTRHLLDNALKLSPDPIKIPP